MERGNNTILIQVQIMNKVIVVATSRKTRGGITSVIKAHESGEQWNKYSCHWVQTHRDGSTFTKLWYFGSGLLDFIIRIPFCDIVHIHTSHHTTAKRKMVFMKIAKLFGKKTIVHFHAFDIESTILGEHKDRYEYMFRNADRVIVLSGWWKEKVSEHIFSGEYKGMRNKVQIIYNPCPVVEKNTQVMREKVILYAGSVNGRKGYADMIKAFAKIATKYPDWKIAFAGNGEIEQGKKLASDLGILEQTVFLGWVTGEAKAKAFQRAAIFCLPSYAEGFPMAVLDAWAYDLSVITTPVGGLPDVAKDGENMLLFNPGDADKLASQMEKLISSYEGDEVLYNKIKAASIDFAENKFNVNTINKQLGDLYEELSK